MDIHKNKSFSFAILVSLTISSLANASLLSTASTYTKIDNPDLDVISVQATANVLILASDLSSDMQLVADLLISFGHTVDIYDLTTSTPVLDDVLLYDVIITWSNFLPDSTNSWGNLLADFIRTGVNGSKPKKGKK